MKAGRTAIRLGLHSALAELPIYREYAHGQAVHFQILGHDLHHKFINPFYAFAQPFGTKDFCFFSH